MDNRKSSVSPYLSDANRLGDVIAAIQAMGLYKFYKLPFAKWSDRISADEHQAEKWKAVFLDHPEFFRLDSTRQNAALVWRRQFPKRYDVDAERILTTDEIEKLSAEQQAKLSRLPLSSSEINALVETAINLHSRALEHQKDKRWWVALASAAGGLVGAAIGALLK